MHIQPGVRQLTIGASGVQPMRCMWLDYHHAMRIYLLWNVDVALCGHLLGNEALWKERLKVFCCDWAFVLHIMHDR